MREKIEKILDRELLLDTQNNELCGFGDVAAEILSLLKEEIKKSLLIDEEIQKIWLRHPASALRTKTGAKRAIAQAQVNNTLKIVEEK